MRRTIAFAALLLALPACGGDDDNSFPGRVPCGAHGEWTSGGVLDSRFTYDDRKHLLTSEVRDGTGALLSRSTRGWEGDDLSWSETEAGTRRYRNDYQYQPAGRMVRWTRADLTPADGDESFAVTYTYAGDEMVGQMFDWVAPTRTDRTATITGERSTLMTMVDCPVDQPNNCDTTTWEQPDSDPFHWTVGLSDLGSDGVIDERYEQTLDSHFLLLTFSYAAIGADEQLEPVLRDDIMREADGTALGATQQLFDDGVVFDTLTETNLFTCPAALTTATPPSSTTGRRALLLDPDAPFALRSHAWR